jgi:hypothetical protein
MVNDPEPSSFVGEGKATAGRKGTDTLPSGWRLGSANNKRADAGGCCNSSWGHGQPLSIVLNLLIGNLFHYS